MRKEKNSYQLDLFCGSDNLYKITKPIRLIEFFAGIGFQRMGIEKAFPNLESWKICEWAIPSIIGYDAIHSKQDDRSFSRHTKTEMVDFLLSKGVSFDYEHEATRKQVERLPLEKLEKVYLAVKRTKNLVNIMKVKGEDLEIIDIDKYEYVITYSFPCFTADTLVLTKNGSKRISDLSISDYVLTHDRTYKRVEKIVYNGKKEIVKLKGRAFDEILTTNNHKFYVKENNKEIKWKEVKDITTNDYLGIAINNESKIPEYNGITYLWNDGRKPRHKQDIDLSNKKLWWVIGRYIGDGWLRSQSGIVICCAKNEINELTCFLNGLFNYNVVEERTVYKVHIPNKELSSYCEQFGKGAENKHLTSDIIDLPVDLLKSFLDGYFSADGCFTKNVIQCNSVSKKLIYDIAQCVAKVYKVPYSIYRVDPPKPKIIERRTVNQKTWWQLRFKLENYRIGYYENGYIWFPLASKENVDEMDVYDIQVEENHSFMANGVIVHNCQDLSLAGTRKGMKVSQKEGGTRSGLVWEFLRIIKECENKPQILLMENVPQVHSKDNNGDFYFLQCELQKLGYKNFWQDMNGKNYGIPQNRDRTFMLSIFDKNADYVFPEPEPLKLRLKDLLEENVDGKYYLSDEHIERIKSWNAQEKPLGNMINFAESERERERE